MIKYPKLRVHTEEELVEQLKNKEIDIDFLIYYICDRDKVYNLLIDCLNEYKKSQSNYKNISIKVIKICNEILTSCKDKTIIFPIEQIRQLMEEIDEQK